MQSSNELENAKLTMQACQKEHGFIKQFKDVEYSTCEPCEQLFDCSIRKKYVDLVYLSMNGGAEGGFEF